MNAFTGFIFLLIILLSGCTQTPKANHPETFMLKGYIEIDGTKLNYVAEGTGKPCLVLGSSIYYPRTFSKQLRDHLRFYFVDMRWFAKEYSPVNLSDFTLQTIIDDIEKVRTELKLEKIIIMGHSIHGTIAFEYAKKHPDKVSQIVMIGSPNNQTNRMQDDAINKLWNTASPERKKIQNKNWQILADMKNLSPAQLEIETYCLMGPKYWYDPNYDAKWLWKDMTLNTEILHYLYSNIFSNYSMFANSRSVPVPTFVAQGRFDYVDPYTLWDGFNNIPGLTFKLFVKSGHYPQLEESELFDRELLNWITKNRE